MDRRQFIVKVIRGSILAGLVGTTGYLALRDSDENGSCTYNFLCSGCNKVRGCSIPEAREYRKNETIKRMRNARG